MAHQALTPAGTVALFGHRYGFADETVFHALNRAYAEVAPELLAETDPPRTE